MKNRLRSKRLLIKALASEKLLLFRILSEKFKTFVISHLSMSLIIKCQCCPHIETSQLICTANQLTGFYIRATLALNGLNTYDFCKINLQDSVVTQSLNFYKPLILFFSVRHVLYFTVVCHIWHSNLFLFPRVI